MTRRGWLALITASTLALAVALTSIVLDLTGGARVAVTILQVNLDGPAPQNQTTNVTDSSDLTYRAITDGTATRAGTVYFDGLPTADEGPVALILKVRGRSSSALTVSTLIADMTDPAGELLAGPSFGPLTAAFADYYIGFSLDWYEPDGYYLDYIHFNTHGWDLADVALVSSVPTTDARYTGLEVLPGSATLANVAIVSRDNLDDVRASDNESVALYGHRSVSVDVALSSDSDVQALAEFHANRRSRPAPVLARVDAQVAGAAPVALNALAALDLGDAVTLHRGTVDGRALDFSASVEGLSWDLRPGAQRLTLTTAPSDTYGLYGSASWFLIGESLLGGTAVLAPY